MPPDGAPPDEGPPRRGEVYLEFIALASTVKVSAIDAETGTEVSVFGPRSAPQSELERVALAKLDRALKRASRPPKSPPTARLA